MYNVYSLKLIPLFNPTCIPVHKKLLLCSLDYIITDLNDQVMVLTKYKGI